MNRFARGRCTSCTAPAQVVMQGVALCARCGLERSSAEPSPRRRTRRAVLFGLLSSGFFAKMALGAVALAAAGGIAVTLPTADPAPEKTPAVVQDAMSSNVSGAQVADAPNVEPALLAEVFAAEVQAWGECVSEAASGHSGGAFDPVAACGPMPSSADHGLGTAHAPGLNDIGTEDNEGKVLPAVAQAGDEKVDNPNKPAKPNKPGKDSDD